MHDDLKTRRIFTISEKCKSEINTRLRERSRVQGDSTPTNSRSRRCPWARPRTGRRGAGRPP